MDSRAWSVRPQGGSIANRSLRSLDRTIPWLRTSSDLMMRSCLRRPGLDKQHIPILDNVLFAFRHDLPLRFHACFITFLLEHGEIVHHSLNEGLFEIAMNHTRRLWSFRAVADRPLSHFICACCEERAEVHGFAHRSDDFGQSGFGAKFFAFGVDFAIAFETCEAIFERDGYGDDGVAGGMLFDPFSDFWKVFVFLSDVVLFTKVDKVDHGLGGEEEKWVDDFDLKGVRYLAIISCYG